MKIKNTFIFFLAFLISLSAILLLILGARKFGMDPAADIGDKSVFEFLKRAKAEEAF